MSGQNQSKRIVYFDYLRIVAIGAVVLLHIAAQNFRAVDIGSPAWNTFNIYDSLVRWGVPVFVMISGALFLGKEQPIKKLYQKNILKILILLVFWTILYNLWQPLITHKPLTFKSFIISLTNSPFYLWFLYMLIGLYMAVPFLKRIVEKKKTMEYFLLLVFIFAFLIPELSAIIAFKSEFIAAIINDKLDGIQLFMVLGFTGYFVLGHYLNKYNITKKAEIAIYIVGLIGIIFTIAATALLSNRQGELVTLFYENLTINVAATSIAIFIFFKKHINPQNLTQKQNKWLQLFSRCSSGVYLTHVFIIDALNIIFDINSLSFNPLISVPLLSLLILVISYLISIVLYKIPFIGKWLI